VAGRLLASRASLVGAAMADSGTGSVNGWILFSLACFSGLVLFVVWDLSDS
jgi:hypothetical protein